MSIVSIANKLFEQMSLASKMEHREPISQTEYLKVVEEIDVQIKMLEFQMSKLKHVAENLRDYPVKESDP